MRFPLIGAAFAIALAPLGALADPPRGCPPGLAKKEPRCVPPGHARNYRDYDRDRQRDWDDRRDYSRYYGRDLGNGYYVLREPRRFNLDPRYNYYVRDGRIYRVDPQTEAILDIVGALQTLLN